MPPWATLVRAPNPGPMTLDGTNTWILRAPGHPAAVVVDPGPLDEGHLAAVAAHGPVEGVLLTHGHPDHTDGLARFLELTGATVGETGGGLRVERLPTPGHTADSVCYLVEGEAVLTGDTILGRGSTVVAWPDGNLRDYLASLRSLAASGPLVGLPGHGPVIESVPAAAARYLAHRAERLEQVRAAVAAGARTPREVVEAVYAEVDPALWGAAELSVRAQLEYLS
jgi:glyoxylase-like metal-dependent hydrolase (beta-lactamase superfamily II)